MVKYRSSISGNENDIIVLQLNDFSYQQSTLYRLKKGSIVHFRLGPSLYGRNVSVFINIPSNVDTAFARDSYRKLEWLSDSHFSDDTSLYIELFINRAGTFKFYFTHTEGSNPNPRGDGYFVIDPILSVGTDHKVLPLDGIQCQTVLSKCLGPFDEWKDRLRVSKECGFNMIHFSPVQLRGNSNSAYSLADQHHLSESFRRTDGNLPNMDDLKALTKQMREEWNMLSICDVVLNHTASNSSWLNEQPQCAYNMNNCSYLRPAYLLDRVLDCLTRDILAGRWVEQGLCPVAGITNEEHLHTIRQLLNDNYIPSARLHEFFQCDIEAICDKFKFECLSADNESMQQFSLSDFDTVGDLNLLPVYNGLRFGRNINMAIAQKIFCKYDDKSRLDFDCDIACDNLRVHLTELNCQQHKETYEHLSEAVNNIISAIKYERIDPNGPKYTKISYKTPLCTPYFSTLNNDDRFNIELTIEQEEELMYGENCDKLMAHNGWVMGDDPLRDFAQPGTMIYFRRELIAWGDCIKLRYGTKPDDCIFLWNYMKYYMELVATIFHGIRLDNCHSTPLHVAEFMIDAARRIRPDIYVVAELFTNDFIMDNMFVNRLGINSLIREALGAWNCHEQGRLVYLYGGEPVASFLRPRIRNFQPCGTHALFMDQTHDNQSPIEKRCVYDLTSSAAIVHMAGCAIGSNRGYDELVPHHIHVVDEERFYKKWSDSNDINCVNQDTGIIRLRQLLNEFHFKMAIEGFTQVFVDQVTPDIVTITRHCPVDHRSYILAVNSAFESNVSLNMLEYKQMLENIRPIKFQGCVRRVVFEAKLLPASKSDETSTEPFTKNDSFINGLESFQLHLRSNLSVKVVQENTDDSNNTQDTEYSEMLVLQGADDGYSSLKYVNFPPSSVCLLEVFPTEITANAVDVVRTMVDSLSVITDDNSLSTCLQSLSLSDFNRLLFSCQAEEREAHVFKQCVTGTSLTSSDTYFVPGVGPFVFAGLHSICSLLKDIGVRNDLGHPLCHNIREGDWLIDFLLSRLAYEPSMSHLYAWLSDIMYHIKLLPRYLIPTYLGAILHSLHSHVLKVIWSKMSKFVQEGSIFVKELALSSIQFVGCVWSARLPTLSSNLSPPQPRIVHLSDLTTVQYCPTIAAGLPHFSTGFMRNWGRDTFIALRGVLLITGRYDEARFLILAYAGCLRHGLIPNLLDGGVKARFNCRDAVWWWLYCIQNYVEIVNGGYSILKDGVSRLFPDDIQVSNEAGETLNKLEDVIQEAMQRHFEGLEFREYNAGHELDEHMSDQGFNNQIGVDMNSGFVFGGNAYNCGTWMDKMGSSVAAGNKGKPATPRDGSAVELVGLCRSAVSWLARMHELGYYSHSEVKKTVQNNNISWTWSEWCNKIDAHFDKCFYIDSTEDAIQANPEMDQDLVNQRTIYKDSYGASSSWCDYQFRCNYAVTLAVAPEMFSATIDHAWAALDMVEQHLRGPLGLKTLHESDMNYNGYYNANDQGDDPKTAHGFNYHNGPEWIWPLGFYLRARLYFANKMGSNILQETLIRIKQILSKHYTMLSSSEWSSLPELTNRNGEVCPFSCPAQAWSVGCILDVVYDIQKYEKMIQT